MIKAKAIARDDTIPVMNSIRLYRKSLKTARYPPRGVFTRGRAGVRPANYNEQF